MVKHHPAPELLASFSAGSLPLSYALCVSAHLDFCPECQINVQRLQGLGADMFSGLSPAPASGDLKKRVMAGIENSAPTAELAKAIKPSPDSDVPRSLRQFVPENYDKLDWRSITRAIKSTTLCREQDRIQLSMLKIKPGGKVGQHGHLGEELTLILEGSFSDDDGIYQKGDFLLRDGSHRHNPVASRDGPCLCLTVQEAPIQFTGFFSRLLNPFLRRSYGHG